MLLVGWLWDVDVVIRKIQCRLHELIQSLGRGSTMFLAVATEMRISVVAGT